MAKQLQIRGGTTVQHSTFTGALREITIDTDKDVVVVHDGTTVGGFPLAKQTSVDSKVTKVTSTDNAVVRFNGVTGDVQNSGVIIDDNNNVGIGVAPSAWNTNIKAIEQGSRTSLFELNGDTILNNNSYINTSSQWIRKTANACAMYEQLNGGHYWSNVPTGTAGNAITWNTAMVLDASGNLLLQSGTGGLGYGTGAGGTVTQLTSKSTAVVLNKPTGRIYTSDSALADGQEVAFTVYNNLIGEFDNVIVSPSHFSESYNIKVKIQSEQFRVTIKNVSGTTLSNTILLNFAIIKGSNL